MEKLTLKMLRVKFNLSQDEVAGRLNISAATWSKWERAINFPSVPDIKKIEKLFNITYADIDFKI
ncbi:helix-turn-helix domain-containing protein [Gemella sp. zg-570]|uniref:helix-turn-helix domain-containing protein n=1 Tax=Gemella sp. zg-570 TaxID=2840371 RepID=UPI001C0E4884|nr:helix-turn-helix transcriptional regulator [Gemella sp. zg-570]QWQ38333.1 helix-turn-helix domain-containing protein [Gemella sp. zg-570]QWQ39261.1 helix-turn-helix domain-containing protein [Gemella sp. zg-570]QWQ39337.1 helix-turn-helix domain-containing protein [Gemella sp. zg-570]